MKAQVSAITGITIGGSSICRVLDVGLQGASNLKKFGSIGA
jgi:hypothetical protein